MHEQSPATGKEAPDRRLDDAADSMDYERDPYEFTIGQFAKLHNISLGSLHYYERLGLLKPERVNPRTKYRYYGPQQLHTLDTIQLCVSLGIPLKTLSDYKNSHGDLDIERILTFGRDKAREQIRLMQRRIDAATYLLDRIRDRENALRRLPDGTTGRDIATRHLVTIPVESSGTAHDIARQMHRLSTKLFRDASAQNLMPLMPPGLLITRTDDGFSLRCFLEVPDTHDGKDGEEPDWDGMPQSLGVMELPAGLYRCTKVKHSSGHASIGNAMAHATVGALAALVAVPDETESDGHPVLELQEYLPADGRPATAATPNGTVAASGTAAPPGPIDSAVTSGEAAMPRRRHHDMQNRRRGSQAMFEL